MDEHYVDYEGRRFAISKEQANMLNAMLSGQRQMWIREFTAGVLAAEKVKPEPQVASSVEATLAQRGSRYGDFTDHAKVCQELKETMVKPTAPGRGWEHLSPVQKQALEVIADKIARILTGDPNYDDNWHDIQGYAKLVEDRLPKRTK